MTETELLEYARWGVRRKLREIVDQLADLYRHFPDEFANPPVLLLPNDDGTPPVPLRPVNVSVADGADLWEVAREACHATGLPWTDPRTGTTHPPPTLQPSTPSTPPTTTDKVRASWTPERRERMRQALNARRPMIAAAKKAAEARREKKGAPGAARTRATGDNGHDPWGVFAWQRLHDFLATQDKRTAAMSAIRTGAQIPIAATVVSAVNGNPTLFQRVDRGVYRLTKIVAHE